MEHRRTATQVLWLAINYVVTVAIIATNKVVLALGVPAVSLTLFHFITCWLFLRVAHATGSFTHAPGVKMNPTLWAIVAAQSFGVIFSHNSLLLNTIGFFQVAKQLQTPVIATMEFFFMQKRVSALRSLFLVLICLGVVMATVTDVQFNLLGALCALGALGCAAVEMVGWSFVQQVRKLESLQAMDLVMPWCIVSMSGIAPAVDFNRWGGVDLSAFTAVMVVTSCALAFLVNWSSIMVAGKSSALTYSLLGQFKTISILLCGFLVFGEDPTIHTVGGALMALASLGAYTHFTMRENEREREKAAREQPEAEGGGAEAGGGDGKA